MLRAAWWEREKMMPHILVHSLHSMWVQNLFQVWIETHSIACAWMYSNSSRHWWWIVLMLNDQNEKRWIRFGHKWIWRVQTKVPIEANSVLCCRCLWLYCVFTLNFGCDNGLFWKSVIAKVGAIACEAPRHSVDFVGRMELKLFVGFVGVA